MLAVATLLRFPLYMLPVNFHAVYAYANEYILHSRGTSLSKIFRIKTASALSVLKKKNVENNEKSK